MMIVAFHILIGGGGWKGAEPVVAAAESPGSVSEAVVVAIGSCLPEEFLGDEEPNKREGGDLGGGGW
jgi:hypothetical protein